MRKTCEVCDGKGYEEVSVYDYNLYMCDECEWKGYIEAESNSYLVTIMNKDYEKIIIDIEKSVNRPNDPDDQEIIYTYVRYHYGDVLYDASLMEKANEIVEIHEDWNIEKYR